MLNCCQCRLGEIANGVNKYSASQQRVTWFETNNSYNLTLLIPTCTQPTTLPPISSHPPHLLSSTANCSGRLQLLYYDNREPIIDTNTLSERIIFYLFSNYITSTQLVLSKILLMVIQRDLVGKFQNLEFNSDKVRALVFGRNSLACLCCVDYQSANIVFETNSNLSFDFDPIYSRSDQTSSLDMTSLSFNRNFFFRVRTAKISTAWMQIKSFQKNSIFSKI